MLRWKQLLNYESIAVDGHESNWFHLAGRVTILVMLAE
jgi:hypothetical protein